MFSFASLTNEHECISNLVVLHILICMDVYVHKGSLLISCTLNERCFVRPPSLLHWVQRCCQQLSCRARATLLLFIHFTGANAVTNPLARRLFFSSVLVVVVSMDLCPILSIEQDKNKRK